MRLNTKQLSHSKRNREFVAEASDIRFNGMSQVISVESEKTGVVVEFQYSTTHRTEDEDSEITRWVYTITRASATKVPALVGYSLHILND